MSMFVDSVSLSVVVLDLQEKTSDKGKAMMQPFLCLRICVSKFYVFVVQKIHGVEVFTVFMTDCFHSF